MPVLHSVFDFCLLNIIIDEKLNILSLHINQLKENKAVPDK